MFRDPNTGKWRLPDHKPQAGPQVQFLHKVESIKKQCPSQLPAVLKDQFREEIPV